MANDIRLSNVIAVDMADAILAQLDIGSTACEIDHRTAARPADPDTAATGTLLATNVCTDPFSPAATDGAPGGLLTASAINDDASAAAGGTAFWGRMRSAGAGADDLFDFEIGTSASDLNMNTLAYTMGSTVSITALTITAPEA